MNFSPTAAVVATVLLLAQPANSQEVILACDVGGGGPSDLQAGRHIYKISDESWLLWDEERGTWFHDMCLAHTYMRASCDFSPRKYQATALSDTGNVAVMSIDRTDGSFSYEAFMGPNTYRTSGTCRRTEEPTPPQAIL